MNRHFHLGVPAALALLAAIGCDSTQVASTNADRVLPTVTIALQGLVSTPTGTGSVNVRSPLSVRVTASDNTALAAIVTRVEVDGVLLQTDDAVFPAAATTFDRTIQIPLAGVRSGQQLTVTTSATDANGNTADDAAGALAFDPNVPQAQIIGAEAAVIVGGTYSISVQALDVTVISKIGYISTGTGALTDADSTLLPTPLPVNDTSTFTLQIPGSATVNETFTVQPFAENRDGLRATGATVTVRIASLGADVQSPIVVQTVAPRLEAGDLMDFTARDPDGLIRIVGYIASDSAGNELHRSADTLATMAQQVARQKAFDVPTTYRGRGLFIIGYAIDASGKTGYSVPSGATIPVTTVSLAKRDPAVFAYGLTSALPVGSLGADIAVDTIRNRVYVSNINKNQLEVWDYGTTLSPLPAVSVGAMPWGMVIDNSGSLLLVANSGGTNISKVNLLTRVENGRVKTANEYLFEVEYAKDDQSGGFKYKVNGPFDYSDRPQYIAQSASGALYYSTRPTSAAQPGTLRRIDNFLDARTEPRQIWQYGTRKVGRYVIINADAVDMVPGATGQPDLITICDHTVGNSPTTATCVTDMFISNAIAALRTTPVNGNVDAVKDLDIGSLALPDTNFVAVGGDRRRVAFGEANTGGRAGRVMMVYDPSGTPAYQEQYSAPIDVFDLTNNASDRVFGLALNNNSTNLGVHGVETFFADTSLRLQGKFATFSSGAGIAFHPRNADDQPADLTERVAFVASGDMSIQIVDSYSYRLRGRIPLRANLYGALRAVPPTAAEQSADPTLVVKLFGLTPQGIVVIDVRRQDIDNVPQQ